MVDWREPENRREGFLRLYEFVTRWKAHTEGTYFFLPEIVKDRGIEDSDEALAWLAWIDGNTQNPITSSLILKESPTPEGFERAKVFVNENYSKLAWDTDRRHQKSKFIEATEKLFDILDGRPLHEAWLEKAEQGSKAVWDFAISLPYMGRLSAWGLFEKTRFLLGEDRIPDVHSMMLEDVHGSHSYRNGLALIAGYDAAYWDNEACHILGIVDDLSVLADDLLRESQERLADIPDVNRFTLESTLCMYKLMWKPRQRYPMAYIDRAYNQVLKAEKEWNGEKDFQLFLDAISDTVPEGLHPEDTGGWDTKKTELFREQGVLLHIDEERK